MSVNDRKSSDGSSIADIIAEFTDGDGIPGQQVPVKKLSDAFDGCAKGEGQMRVYLRIRPISAKGTSESTITVDSGTFDDEAFRASIYEDKCLRVD